MHNRRFRSFLAPLALLLTLVAAAFGGSRLFVAPPVTVQRVAYQVGQTHLVVEVLRDDLVHFEYSLADQAPDVAEPLYTTPMVAKTDYPGPSRFADDGQGTLTTADLALHVDPTTLALTVVDTTSGHDVVLTTVAPRDTATLGLGLKLTPEGTQNVYGLGEQFVEPGTAQGDWLGRERTPGSPYGNDQVVFNKGAAGNDEFPIMYALGPGHEGYGLFLDQVPPASWDFTTDPWQIKTPPDHLRAYILSGPDLADLRQDYMELTGRPPVPPKAAFGLWVSEWGYDNWAELEDKLRTLRTNGFPVDGFVLDMQWYGGVREGSADTPMGGLNWDTASFPDPAGEIARLRDEQGVGLIAIEEPYVGRDLPEHAQMASQGFLVRDGAGGPPTYLQDDIWWGVGGLIDFTNSAGADYWHDWKRQPLVDAGIAGHWIDLGEPQMFSRDDWYAGLPGADQHFEAANHNIYNFLWAASIARGYARNGVERRPLILSRSGTAGIQRFGTAMWSGDIASRLSSLAAHLNVQMHMSLSGVDYYGSDIGGFIRISLDGDLDDLYTRWFADGAAYDVPVRPHTENLCNCKETAPDRVGDLASNLANLRQRYELVPYLYSLAHRAYRYGEPVVPPLVYYYQDDPNVRDIADEKLLGRDLLVASDTTYGAAARDVYLPAGRWVNYYTGEWLTSAGATFADVPEYVDGLFRLPTFARAGAILPQMYVDEKTMNVSGRRTDGTTRDELILRVYADPTPSSFTLYEDDGETIAYQQGAVRTTELSQALAGDVETVTIAAAQGTYAGATRERDNVLELVVDGRRASGVTLDGAPLQECATQAEFDAAPSGWYNAGENLILARSGRLDVAAAKVFRVTLTPAG